MLKEKNCEDILFNYAAAAAIRDASHSGASQQQQQQQRSRQQLQQLDEQAGGLPPHAVWSQPSRRLDISFLSGVGISKSGSIHEGAWAGADLPAPAQRTAGLACVLSAVAWHPVCASAWPNPTSALPSCPLQPSGVGACSCSASGMATSCGRSRCSGTARAPRGACSSARSAGCPPAVCIFNQQMRPCS